jgi:hypothetical protein
MATIPLPSQTTPLPKRRRSQRPSGSTASGGGFFTEVDVLTTPPLDKKPRTWTYKHILLVEPAIFMLDLDTGEFVGHWPDIDDVPAAYFIGGKVRQPHPPNPAASHLCSVYRT